MDEHEITRETLEATLHNINVLLYAFEEVVLHSGTELRAMTDVKAAFELLRKEFDASDFPPKVTFKAPTPARSLLSGEPSQRLRKNVCSP